MWPDLFGPGWLYEVLLSFGFLGAFAGFLKFLERLYKEPIERPDPLLALWHRYEEGDLTRREFERLRLASRPPSGAYPFCHSIPNPPRGSFQSMFR